jgi:cyclopropane-fatty-acyl-phospholipid synthase
MRFLELESSRAAYRADFVVYGTAAAGLSAAVLLGAPSTDWPYLAVVLSSGYLMWGLLEYLLHRFVLHGLQPFRAMHEQHHQRPQARLGTPTVISAPLFAGLVFLPAWRLLGLWPACALMSGVLVGYLAYSLAHHMCHHPNSTSAWSSRRMQRWHARHHARLPAAGCYGVSNGLWDQVFGTDRSSGIPRTDPASRVG